jgi:hypothetical protein
MIPPENHDDYAVRVLTERLDTLTGWQQFRIAVGHGWRRYVFGSPAADAWLRARLDVEWLDW